MKFLRSRGANVLSCGSVRGVSGGGRGRESVLSETSLKQHELSELFNLGFEKPKEQFFQ